MFIVEDDNLLPERKTAKSAGLDIRAREMTLLEPFTPTIVPIGVRIDVNAADVKSVADTHFLTLAVRSSLALRGITLANVFPVIDLDYPDEIGVLLINYGKNPVVINRYERIAQLLLLPHETAAIMRSVKHTHAERVGGFGSTGKH